MDLKFCKDCKYAKTMVQDVIPCAITMPVLVCQHEKNRRYDLTSGDYSPLECKDARDPFKMLHGAYVSCGAEGNLFEPRESGVPQS